MHRLPDILFLFMAAITQIRLVIMQQRCRVRLVRLMAVIALPKFHRQVRIFLIETLLVMAPEAQFRNGHIQQFVIVLGVRVMTGSALARDHRWVYMLG
jgi:hypothetical protein